MKRRNVWICVVGVLGSCGAGSALAQDVVAYPSGALASHAGSNDPVATQIESWTADAPPPLSVPLQATRSRGSQVDRSPWGKGLYTQVAPGVDAALALQTPSAAPLDQVRRIHGEVEAAVGTNGLRAASGIVAIPVGEDATVVLAVSSAHYGR